MLDVPQVFWRSEPGRCYLQNASRLRGHCRSRLTVALQRQECLVVVGSEPGFKYGRPANGHWTD